MADEKPAQPAAAQSTPDAAAPAAATPAARATTCAQCSKRLDRKKQYYRNGRYFCNKRCFKAAAAGMPAQQAAG